jgi:hypothetical protein
LQRAFPLDVLIVPSSAITVAADGERLTCGGFTLGETIRLVTFKFIADYFDDLSLSPIRGDLGAAFMGSSHSGTPSPWWAMIEDSVEEFLMVSSGDVGFGLPSPRRRGRGFACSHHNHNMDGERSGHSSHDDGSTADGGATVEYQPPSSVMPHLARGQQAQAHAWQHTAEQEAPPRRSKLTGKQAATVVQSHVPPRHEPALEAERIQMVDFASTQARGKEVASPAGR